MKDIYIEILNALKKSEKTVLATVVRRAGSAPRATGAKYLIKGDGTSLGTIGGGGVEARVWQEAQEVLKTGEGKLLHFELTAKEIAEGGQVCGGNVDIFLEPLQEDYIKVYQEAVRIKEKGGSAVLTTLVSKDGNFLKGKGAKALLKMSGEKVGDLPAGKDWPTNILREAKVLLREKKEEILTFRSQEGEVEILVEPLFPEPALYIFGGGHIAQQLAPLAQKVHFKVMVIDDREAYANRSVFSEADEVIAVKFENCFERLPIDECSYIVIVTRGHLHDYHVLEQAIATQARYIGMIGSKRKIQILFKNLREKGISQETLDRVHAPIGIEIGAETPEEIAISIVAELIQARAL